MVPPFTKDYELDEVSLNNTGAPMSPDLLAHMCRELPQLLTFVTWLLRSFIADIPPSLEESAIIDGCSRFQAMWYVVAP